MSLARQGLVVVKAQVVADLPEQELFIDLNNVLQQKQERKAKSSMLNPIAKPSQKLSSVTVGNNVQLFIPTVVTMLTIVTLKFNEYQTAECDHSDV